MDPINRLIRFDEQTIGNASVDNLDRKLWERFKTPLSPQEDIEFLLKLKLVSPDEDGTLYPTISGILMASESPDQFISSFLTMYAHN